MRKRQRAGIAPRVSTEEIAHNPDDERAPISRRQFTVKERRSGLGHSVRGYRHTDTGGLQRADLGRLEGFAG